MNRRSAKQRRLFAAAAKLKAEFHAAFPRCWWCGAGPSELHHIAGRGVDHDCRVNYSSFCRKHHNMVQGAPRWLPHVMALKRARDGEHYDLDRINCLRGTAAGAITPAEIIAARKWLRLRAIL